MVATHPHKPGGDDIEVHYDARRGVLSLACGEGAFVRLRELVIAEAGVGDIIGGRHAEVWSIEVEVVPPRRPSNCTRDRIVWLGCGVVGVAVLILLAIGAITLANWVR